jgi:hypothetical protein
MIDCGMSHYHDKEIREALIEIAPNEKSLIEGMTFGEIAKPYVETRRIREKSLMLGVE